MTNNIKEYKDQFCKIADIFRGSMDAEKVFCAMIAFVVIRRIDCLIRNKSKECEDFYEQNRLNLSDERLDQELIKIVGGKPFYNVSGYTLYSIYHKQTSIEISFRSYLDGFSANVKEILFDLNFDSVVAILNRQSKYLVDVLSILTSIEMSEYDNFSDEDFDDFISYIKDFFQKIISRGSNMQITPEPLVKLMVSCLLDRSNLDSCKESVSVLDPVCGTGSLLLAAKKKLSQSYSDEQIKLFGQDLNPTMVALTKAMLLFSRNNRNRAFVGNTLLTDCFKSTTFDYILGSFPFGLSWRGIEELVRKEEGFGRFSLGLPSTRDSQFLFIQHMISKMNPEGSRVVTITSGNALWGTDGTNIRRKMFEMDIVESIIALPGGALHPMSSIPLYVWILSNCKDKKRQGKVQLINGQDMIVGNKTNGLSDSLIEKILTEYANFSNNQYSQVLSNESFSFYRVKLHHTKPYRVEEVQIPVTQSINEYLAEEVYPYTKGEVEIDYKSVEKGCSIQMDSFFDKGFEKISLADSSTRLHRLANEIASLNEKISKVQQLPRYLEYQKVSSVYEIVPVHWHAFPLSVLSDISNGQARPRTPEIEDGLPYITLDSLRTKEKANQGYEPSLKSKVVSKDNVIIVARGASVGEVYPGMEGILSSGLLSLKASNEVLPRFFYYLMKGHERMFMSMTKGVGSAQIDLEALKVHKIFIPSVQEQKEIIDNLDKIIDNIDRIIALLGNNETEYSTYRQALIENVVFGQIKLVNNNG